MMSIFTNENDEVTLHWHCTVEAQIDVIEPRISVSLGGNNCTYFAVTNNIGVRFQV